MGRRSFARSTAPIIPTLERIKKEQREEERKRIKKVMEERKKARANLKKINDKIRIKQDREVEKIIKKAKENTVKDIKELKIIFKDNFQNLTKEKLIKIFNDFKKEDFCCFAKDGNTYLTPEKYYKNISLDKLEREQKTHNCSNSFHEINGELGVNLLKCCGKCKNLFLENKFKTWVYILIKESFKNEA